MFFCTPRFSVHSVITGPTYSCGTRIVAVMTGSRISSTRERSGSFDGLSISSHRAVAHQHLVDDGGRRRDQVHVVLALEPLLHDVHVQQAQEAAAEAEAQRLRHLGLVSAATRRSA
jgi:hypothetical protein